MVLVVGIVFSASASTKGFGSACDGTKVCNNGFVIAEARWGCVGGLVRCAHHQDILTNEHLNVQVQRPESGGASPDHLQRHHQQCHHLALVSVACRELGERFNSVNAAKQDGSTAF
eukprot:2256133-Amphidinium_carterae.2